MTDESNELMNSLRGTPAVVANGLHALANRLSEEARRLRLWAYDVSRMEQCYVMSRSDLPEWARETALTWTEGNFANLSSWIENGCPDTSVDLDALGVTAEYGNAMSAYVQEVARELSNRAAVGLVSLLIDRSSDWAMDSSLQHELRDARLAHEAPRVGDLTATALGRAVACERQRQHMAVVPELERQEDPAVPDLRKWAEDTALTLTDRALQAVADPVGCSAVAYIEAIKLDLVHPTHPDQGRTERGEAIFAYVQEVARELDGDMARHLLHPNEPPQFSSVMDDLASLGLVATDWFRLAAVDAVTDLGRAVGRERQRQYGGSDA